jgi:hypothetical protein
MKRPHRTAHRTIWFMLACAVGFGFALALILRPPLPVETPATSQESGK